MHDLLQDELIGVRTAQGTRRVNLPQLLGLLCAGEVQGYTGLHAHQADPWHVFLVQLATAVAGAACAGQAAAAEAAGSSNRSRVRRSGVKLMTKGV